MYDNDQYQQGRHIPHNYQSYMNQSFPYGSSQEHSRQFPHETHDWYSPQSYSSNRYPQQNSNPPFRPVIDGPPAFPRPIDEG